MSFVRPSCLSCLRGLVAAVAVVLAIAGVAAQAPTTADPGAEVLQTRCLSCHGSDLIESQRLSRDGWTRELDKMVRWGARVPDTEREPLLAHLTARFGPALAVASRPRASEGEATFARACLSCHGADLTEQQRLSPTGWTREVEKMMRWGARVTDDDKRALVDYLASRFPVR